MEGRGQLFMKTRSQKCKNDLARLLIKFAFRTGSFEIREDVEGRGVLSSLFPRLSEVQNRFPKGTEVRRRVRYLCGEMNERYGNPIQESIAVSSANDVSTTTCSELSGCGCEIWDPLPPESFSFPPLRLCKVVLLGSTLPVIRSTMLTSLPSTFCVLTSLFPLRRVGRSDGSGGAPLGRTSTCLKRIRWEVFAR